MEKTRILVVDDEPNLSGLVTLFLDRAGRFTVRVENDSTRALKAAREFRPHLVLLDISMPGKDGGEVAREIEADPVLSTTAILFLTSLVTPEEAGEHERRSGEMHFLPKPFGANTLIEAIDRAMAEQAARSLRPASKSATTLAAKAAGPAPNPSLTRPSAVSSSIRAARPLTLGSQVSSDIKSLQRELENAKLDLSGKASELASMKALFDKTRRHLIQLETNVTQLRDERHRLANQAMQAEALRRKLESMTADRDRLQKQLDSERVWSG